MKRIARALGAAMLAASALFLSGCATGYLLDNQVQSFSSLTALPAPASYRFERLPSQQTPQQGQLEALADGPLFKAGLRRDDASPRYAVQVNARVNRVLSPYADPWDWGGWGWGWGIGAHHRGIGIGFGGPFGRMEQPWFQREVSIIVREIATNRVVFESRANNDGPWMDNNSVLPAMFDAALNGFPNPPQGPRRVDIHLGAKQQ
jgi:hypothetical protein